MPQQHSDAQRWSYPKSLSSTIENILQWPVSFAGDVANSLIVKIVQLVVDRRETGDEYRRLELEPEPLRQILTLTHLTIQAYEYTSVDRNLKNIVVPEVEQIPVALQHLYDKIDGYRQGLWPTSVRDLWHKIWWRACDVDDD
jgi:hypothetical protein